MNQDINTKEILTVMEVGQFLGICRAKAYELVNQDGFPKFKIGKTIRIRKSALLEWIKTTLEAA